MGRDKADMDPVRSGTSASSQKPGESSFPAMAVRGEDTLSLSNINSNTTYAPIDL